MQSTIANEIYLKLNVIYRCNTLLYSGLKKEASPQTVLNFFKIRNIYRMLTILVIIMYIIIMSHTVCSDCLDLVQPF